MKASSTISPVVSNSIPSLLQLSFSQAKQVLLNELVNIIRSHDCLADILDIVRQVASQDVILKQGRESFNHITAEFLLQLCFRCDVPDNKNRLLADTLLKEIDDGSYYSAVKAQRSDAELDFSHVKDKVGFFFQVVKSVAEGGEFLFNDFNNNLGRLLHCHGDDLRLKLSAISHKDVESYKKQLLHRLKRAPQSQYEFISKILNIELTHDRQQDVILACNALVKFNDVFQLQKLIFQTMLIDQFNHKLKSAEGEESGTQINVDAGLIELGNTCDVITLIDRATQMRLDLKSFYEENKFHDDFLKNFIKKPMKQSVLLEKQEADSAALFNAKLFTKILLCSVACSKDQYDFIALFQMALNTMSANDCRDGLDYAFLSGVAPEMVMPLLRVIMEKEMSINIWKGESIFREEYVLCLSELFDGPSGFGLKNIDVNAVFINENEKEALIDTVWRMLLPKYYRHDNPQKYAKILYFYSKVLSNDFKRLTPLIDSRVVFNPLLLGLLNDMDIPLIFKMTLVLSNLELAPSKYNIELVRFLASSVEEYCSQGDALFSNFSNPREEHQQFYSLLAKEIYELRNFLISRGVYVRYQHRKLLDDALASFIASSQKKEWKISMLEEIKGSILWGLKEPVLYSSGCFSGSVSDLDDFTSLMVSLRWVSESAIKFLQGAVVDDKCLESFMTYIIARAPSSSNYIEAISRFFSENNFKEHKYVSYSRLIKAFKVAFKAVGDVPHGESALRVDINWESTGLAQVVGIFTEQAKRGTVQHQIQVDVARCNFLFLPYKLMVENKIAQYIPNIMRAYADGEYAFSTATMMKIVLRRLHYVFDRHRESGSLGPLRRNQVMKYISKDVHEGGVNRVCYVVAFLRHHYVMAHISKAVSEGDITALLEMYKAIVDQASQLDAPVYHSDDRWNPIAFDKNSKRYVCFYLNDVKQSKKITGYTMNLLQIIKYSILILFSFENNKDLYKDICSIITHQNDGEWFHNTGAHVIDLLQSIDDAKKAGRENLPTLRASIVSKVIQSLEAALKSLDDRISNYCFQEQRNQCATPASVLPLNDKGLQDAATPFEFAVSCVHPEYANNTLLNNLRAPFSARSHQADAQEQRPESSSVGNNHANVWQQPQQLQPPQNGDGPEKDLENDPNDVVVTANYN